MHFQASETETTASVQAIHLHSGKFADFHSFLVKYMSVCLSLYQRQYMPKMYTRFCLVQIKCIPILTFCVLMHFHCLKKASLKIALLVFFFFHTLLIPCGKFRLPYLCKATSAAMAVLPGPTCACCFCPCFRNRPNSDMDYRIFKVRT